MSNFDLKIACSERVPVLFEDNKDKDEDDMTEFLWDGPEDSDEEIACLVPLKTDNEVAQGVKFSKRGLIEYITSFVENESMEKNPLWERKLDSPGIKYFLKKGGSDVNKTQPFFRSQVTLPKVYKMNKLAKCVSIKLVFSNPFFLRFSAQNR